MVAIAVGGVADHVNLLLCRLQFPSPRLFPDVESSLSTPWGCIVPSGGERLHWGSACRRTGVLDTVTRARLMPE
jgi:hypothetical protein